MENIILITGNCKYTITLDPSVWIFDDRRVDLTTYFSDKKEVKDQLEEYTKAVSKHWDREIMEGAIFPPTLKTEKKFEKKLEKIKMLTSTFGISFKPFLENSQPNPDAKIVIAETSEGEIEIPLEKAYELILKFSQDGKQLSEDGPIHLFYGDGSNQQNPFKNVKKFIVK
ncbi:hypothetical protein BIV60_23445 [Bacillus sp. MUM 116]|uniref:hypothetical protein n=1 Tax=Bacillus sp. MUM 116 TaxID=1678002 RepID=UPI0008F5E768|nr:hypothetical protein [Bacillus sp. MUM 116]OIK09633.1 hypothetical protein BIV60_23445 [Bacillus sp. MUM 116]